MSRLPIRLRVTIAFAAAMAVVLLAVGWLIQIRYRDELDSSIDRGLRARAGDVVTLLREPGGGANLLPERSESLGEDNFAQILTGAGRVLDTAGRPSTDAILAPDERHAAEKRPIYAESNRVPGFDARARLLATSATANGRRLIVVVGTPLDDRDAALASLATLLWLGGGAALLLASLVGYAAVTASLRPVEAIRRQAGEVSAADPTRRLPVPRADDELRRLGETLNQMLARLEAALERERSFVDDASHELRTPLAMQRAELELALRHAGGVDELRAAIASAIDEVDRISQLAEDLLVLARSDKGKLPVQLERVEVGPMLAAVRDRYQSRAQALGCRLDADTANGLSVQADRMRLEQALGNLVDNAFRHGEGPVEIWARADGPTVELHVCDAGAGFEPAFIARAFERFSRADEARTEPGTGLGLAIVKAIAAAHRGAAMAANRGDGGADVWIAIPAGPQSLS